MSTIVNFLLAATIQFLGVSTPVHKEYDSALTNQQCQEQTSALPYSKIINNEHELHKTNN